MKVNSIAIWIRQDHYVCFLEGCEHLNSRQRQQSKVVRLKENQQMWLLRQCSCERPSVFWTQPAPMGFSAQGALGCTSEYEPIFFWLFRFCWAHKLQRHSTFTEYMHSVTGGLDSEAQMQGSISLWVLITTRRTQIRLEGQNTKKHKFQNQDTEDD